MTFSVTTTYGKPSPKEIEDIHQSIETGEGYLYVHRLPTLTPAIVIYFTGYLNQLITEHGYHRMIYDFTNRQFVSHGLRKLMIEQMQESLSQLTEMTIVFEGSAIRRTLIDFFVRGYLRKRGITVSFCTNKAEAIALMVRTGVEDKGLG